MRLVDELPAGHPARGWEFASAGIAGLEGWPMDEGMAAELEVRGASAAGFVASQVSGAVLRPADLVLTLETVHRAWILEEWPALVRRTLLLGQAGRLAPDLAGHDDVLIAALKAHSGAAQPADAVADPYRRGPAAAARAASEIERALRAILTAAGPSPLEAR